MLSKVTLEVFHTKVCIFLGNMPTTEMLPAGDVVMSVIKQSPHNPDGGNTRATPWQQNRGEDSSQTRIVFGYVIVLCSRHTDEIWLCDMTSACPNEVIVVSRLNYFFLLQYIVDIIESCSLVMASTLYEMCL